MTTKETILEAELSELNKQHNRLKSTFTQLLEEMYKRTSKGEKWEGTDYWITKAGLNK